MRVEE
jgi:hypothetical protein